MIVKIKIDFVNTKQEMANDTDWWEQVASGAGLALGLRAKGRNDVYLHQVKIKIDFVNMKQEIANDANRWEQVYFRAALAPGLRATGEGRKTRKALRKEVAENAESY